MDSHSNFALLYSLFNPSPSSQIIRKKTLHASYSSSSSSMNLNRPIQAKNKMNKPPLKKYLDQLRFVLFTIFACYVSLLLFDFYLVVNDRGISSLLVNINNASKYGNLIHEKTSNFSANFSGNIGCPNKTSTNSDGSNVPSDASMMSPITKAITSNLDPCSGKYIFVYNLPSRFNKDLLKRCDTLLEWLDMCSYFMNSGLGPKVIEKSKSKVLSKHGWYKTDQFSLEVIFHNTMKHYKCLTNNSSLASAIYVPFYPGLDAVQYLWGFNTSVRDSSPKALMKWLSQQPEWKIMWGRDHFMVGGRISWDFRRKTDNDSHWGTKLMFLPEAKNMSILLIESGPYKNDISIPYPTYFHPSKEIEIFQWQDKMRRVKRPYLFSFVGAPRPKSSFSIRSELIKHCKYSMSCKLLSCYENICDDPVNVISTFQKSVFCLQPPGDSYTRRSTFDSILAGCIPVFFHRKSAYKQYLWHFPKNGSSYSVYIPGSDVKGNRVLINETLARVSQSEVLAMREEVIRLIPRVIYSDPRHRLETIEDAFDVAVKGILGRIEEIRRGGFESMNNSTDSNLIVEKDDDDDE